MLVEYICWSDLAKVAHLAEILAVYVICPIWHDHLGPLPCQLVDNISSNKARAPKHCCCDAANLQVQQLAGSARMHLLQD